MAVQLERKLSESAVSLDDSGSGGFTGRASAFNGIDSVGDSISPGAYTATLPQFLARGFVTNAHAWDSPIGYFTRAWEASDGLYVEAKFHSDQQAQTFRTRLRERLAAGKHCGLSIGFAIKQWHRRGEVRVLDEVELYEVALVAVGADPLAAVGTAKTPPLDATQRALREIYAEHFLRPRLAELEREERALASVHDILLSNAVAMITQVNR